MGKGDVVGFCPMVSLVAWPVHKTFLSHSSFTISLTISVQNIVFYYCHCIKLQKYITNTGRELILVNWYITCQNKMSTNFCGHTEVGIKAVALHSISL